MAKVIVKRDTSAWRIQTWLSFGLAFAVCFVGVWNLNGEGLERALTTVSLFFLLFTTFTLSKTLRDNQQEQVDTQSWIIMNWLGFGVASALTAWGFFRMNIDFWQKGFLIAGSLFLLSSAFTLAKTIRDAADADLVESESSSSNQPARRETVAAISQDKSESTSFTSMSKPATKV